MNLSKNNIYGYVYLIINKINNKKYIGMHKSKIFDESYYGSGTGIKRAIEKYGKENFIIEILHWCETPELLSIMEIFEIHNRNAVKCAEYYNMIGTPTPILFGERNGFYGRKHSEEVKENLSLKRKDIPITNEHRQKIIDFSNSEEGRALYIKLSKKRKDIPITNEHRQKIIDFYSSEEGKLLRKKLSILRFGKILSIETRNKISIANSGKTRTEETKRKISIAHTGTKKDWVADKINRNPEKIRKTANKHRGMKRSNITRKRISESKKGKPANNKGKMWVHHITDGIKKQIFKHENMPIGFIKGYGNRKK